MRTGTIESAGRRVVGAPPSLHEEHHEGRGATASASNMKTMAMRHRTSTPSVPLVVVVPVASSEQRINETITSTATQPAEGSAIARPRVDAMAREGKGVHAPLNLEPLPAHTGSRAATQHRLRRHTATRLPHTPSTPRAPSSHRSHASGDVQVSVTSFPPWGGAYQGSHQSHEAAIPCMSGEHESRHSRRAVRCQSIATA
jgi:hypothetical protein